MSCEEFGSFTVAQMSGRAGYAFLQKSRIRAELQHLLVIIGFYDQVVRHAHVFTYRFGNMADIRCQRKLMISIFDIITHIIGTIMWDFESSNAEIADHKRHFLFYHLTRTDKRFLHVATLAYPYDGGNGYFLYYNKNLLKAEDVSSIEGLLAKATTLGMKVAYELETAFYSMGLLFTFGADWQFTTNSQGAVTNITADFNSERVLRLVKL